MLTVIIVGSGCHSGDEHAGRPWLEERGPDVDDTTDAISSDTAGPLYPDVLSGDTGDVDADSPDTSPDIDTDAGCPEDGKDTDHDKLTDCRERKMCTAVDDGDTDSDHLSDFEEVEKGYDPCQADTDKDGLEDGVEERFGLDPTDPTSYNDGVQDSQRWFVEACQDERPAPIEAYTETEGNWNAAFRPVFDYKSLSLSNVDAPEAAAVFGSSRRPLAGAILSKNAPSGHSSPLDELNGPTSRAVSQVATVDLEQIGAEFRSHDDKPSAIASYELSVDQPHTLVEMRDDLLFALASFGTEDVTTEMPAPSGSKFQRFRLRIADKYRIHRSGETTHLLEFALVSLSDYKNNPRKQFVLENAAAAENLADAVYTLHTHCEFQRATPNEGPEPELRTRPIPASIRVFVDNQWSPRSFQNGWNYDETSSELRLYGDDRLSSIARQKGHTAWTAIHYQSFRRRCHFSGHEPNTCRPP